MQTQMEKWMENAERLRPWPPQERPAKNVLSDYERWERDAYEIKKAERERMAAK